MHKAAGMGRGGGASGGAASGTQAAPGGGPALAGRPPVLGWRQGMVATVPFSITVGALGIVFGATAGTVGLSGAAALAMSAFVFSGAAQFSSLGLWHEGLAAVLLATLLLGTRFVLMSASIALRLPGVPRWQRLLLSQTILDETYGLFIAAGSGASASFLLGSMLVLYTPWILGTWLGVRLGPLVPASWQALLEAVFPLVFLVLVVHTSGSRSKAVVATLAAALAIGCAVWLPGGWGLLVAGLSASALGPWLAQRLDGAGGGRSAGAASGGSSTGGAREAADAANEEAAASGGEGQ